MYVLLQQQSIYTLLVVYYNALHNTPTIKTLQFLATLYISTFVMYEAFLFTQV